jgi:hypothetical protein
VPDSRESRAISSPSFRLPAIGLSMKTRFFAAKTGRTWAKCCRPSTLVSITASTRLTSSSIESTSGMLHFCCSSDVKRSMRVALAVTSGLPPFHAATTRAPGTWFGPEGSFRMRVNSTTCEVSRPISPMRSGAVS